MIQYLKECPRSLNEAIELCKKLQVMKREVAIELMKEYGYPQWQIKYYQSLPKYVNILFVPNPASPEYEKYIEESEESVARRYNYDPNHPYLQYPELQFVRELIKRRIVSRKNK
ncbi:MAG: hypothetical protein ACFE95_07575 [Candidatus Hodarchaeota archaeon]